MNLGSSPTNSTLPNIPKKWFIPPLLETDDLSKDQLRVQGYELCLVLAKAAKGDHLKRKLFPHLYQRYVDGHFQFVKSKPLVTSSDSDS